MYILNKQAGWLGCGSDAAPQHRIALLFIVMNPVGPSPFGLRLSVERMQRLSIEVDRASWVATMVTTVTVLLVLWWLLAFR
jgi:hypothetical protein